MKKKVLGYGFRHSKEPILKVIQTKYLGPTNNRGSRVKAWDDADNNVTLSWKCELNPDENHLRAVKTLCKKIEMPIENILTGSIKDSYVHFIVRGEA